VSVRSFLSNNEVFRISTAKLAGGLEHLIDIAEDDARRAANNPAPAVFCPPIAVFNGAEKWRARQADLFKGLVLSVECDERPDEARNKLEEILGPATAVVRSGGQWIDEDGSPQDKLHLHWRLAEPASADALDKLKQARKLAANLLPGDPVCRLLIAIMSALPPKADIALHGSECPLCAKSRHMQCSNSRSIGASTDEFLPAGNAGCKAPARSHRIPLRALYVLPHPAHVR
jgi:hypothetical protein